MQKKKTKAELKKAIIDEVIKHGWISIKDDEDYYQSAYVNEGTVYILNEDNELGIDCYSYTELKRIAELIF